MAEHRHRLEKRNAEIGAEIAARRGQQAPLPTASERIPAPASQPAAPDDIESRARREFEVSAALPDEFGNVETYLAFRRAEAAGRIKIFNGVPRR